MGSDFRYCGFFVFYSFAETTITNVESTFCFCNVIYTIPEGCKNNQLFFNRLVGKIFPVFTNYLCEFYVALIDSDYWEQSR
jgi:hypothetical protein